MAQGNHVSLKGDITSDIYYDILEIGDKQTPYLRLYLMINGSREAYPVKGLRICMYGLLAELAYAHVQKGSRIYVEGHVQTREIAVRAVAGMRDRVLDLAAIQDGSQHRAGRRALAVFADADAVTRAVQRRHLNEEQRCIRRRRRIAGLRPG